jgi:hypothetical protein
MSQWREAVTIDGRSQLRGQPRIVTAFPEAFWASMPSRSGVGVVVARVKAIGSTTPYGQASSAHGRCRKTVAEL